MGKDERKERALLERMADLVRPAGQPREVGWRSSPLLGALKRAGTAHIYADTADTRELQDLLERDDGTLIEEVDGNTVNQPLVGKVAPRYLESPDVRQWAAAVREIEPDIGPARLVALLYTLLCARIGDDIVGGFAGGRAWEVSLQLHMGLGADARAAVRAGRALRRMVPTAIVKVPFTPQHPHCFLVARDLEREGIPVNFTSTFSARQVVAAALLADVTRTNIFMGRLNSGLKAGLLGEQVDLEAQRALRRLRGEAGVKTRLIVASLHEWRTFVQTAGCDVYTAPCRVIRAFLDQEEVPPERIASRLDASYLDRLGIDPAVLDILSLERISRLWRVEPELVGFLRELRGSEEYGRMTDGEELARRFEREGFADLFYAPSPEEWVEMRRSKLPDLQSALTRRIALDTLYSLLADADFENEQAAIDRQIESRL